MDIGCVLAVYLHKYIYIYYGGKQIMVQLSSVLHLQIYCHCQMFSCVAQLMDSITIVLGWEQ